jgi:hypothetical protein
MWPTQFERRLESWNNLRQTAKQLPTNGCLQQINAWWQSSPWVPYHLHWDDRPTWPDPWQLLSDNVYCDLAKALGIMYTLVLIDRPEFANARLIETENSNLVQIDQGKYILNWGRDIVLNNNLEQTTIRNSVDFDTIKTQIL